MRIERSSAIEAVSAAQPKLEVSSPSWARTVSTGGGQITLRKTISAAPANIAIVNVPAPTIARGLAGARPGAGANGAETAAGSKACIDGSRSSGFGASIGAITGRNSAGTAERSGSRCRAAIIEVGDDPMSSFWPKPIAELARTRPRL